MTQNPQRRTMAIWLWVAAAGTAIAALPFAVEIDMFKGGGVMVFGGSVVALTALCVAFLYLSRAKTLDRILEGRDLLAHWTYTPEEWGRYSEEEHQRHSGGMAALFWVVAVISFLVGGGFLLFAKDKGAAVVVFLVLMGVVALCGVAALLSVRAAAKRNRERHGEAFVALAGVFLNGSLHTWNSWGGRLDGVKLLEGAIPCVEFSYSYPAKTGRSYYDVRVPVPCGKEVEAGESVAKFNGAEAAAK